MNPTEIYDALDEIASAPFDAAEFPFVFAEATDNARATISKLRNGSTNKSDIAGGVLLNRKFHYAPAPRGGVGIVLDRLRASRRTASAKPAILVTTDGEEVAAEHVASGDPLHCRFDEISNNYLFFLPAAGKERYKPEEESPLDVGATGKLAKLYDALIKANPEWAGEARRHSMNQLMMRLIFCLFAEDVGIFPEGQFSRLVFTHSGERGEEAREVIVAAFQAMNLPKDTRPGLPGWTAEIEYVNGGLFAGEIDAPRFDPIAFRYLKDAANLTWGRHIERTQIYANGPRPVANGNHLFSDASRVPSENALPRAPFLRDKPHRIGQTHGNVVVRVFRTCWSATCAFPPATIGSRSPCSATPCAPPAWTRAISMKTRPRARATTAPD